MSYRQQAGIVFWYQKGSLHSSPKPTKEKPPQPAQHPQHALHVPGTSSKESVRGSGGRNRYVHVHVRGDVDVDADVDINVMPMSLSSIGCLYT